MRQSFVLERELHALNSVHSRNIINVRWFHVGVCVCTNFQANRFFPHSTIFEYHIERIGQLKLHHCQRVLVFKGFETKRKISIYEA